VHAVGCAVYLPLLIAATLHRSRLKLDWVLRDPSCCKLWEHCLACGTYHLSEGGLVGGPNKAKLNFKFIWSGEGVSSLAQVSSGYWKFLSLNRLQMRPVYASESVSSLDKLWSSDIAQPFG